MGPQAENYYLLVVHNFSGEQAISQSKAEVILEMAHHKYEFACPSDGDGDIWLVCLVNTYTSGIEVINRITSEAPPQLGGLNRHRRISRDMSHRDVN